MKFREYRDASDRLTVTIEDMPSLFYRVVRWKLCRAFDLKKSNDYVKGLNEKFQTFSHPKGDLNIDWDTWSGFTVTALSSESESIVKNIGDWLNKKYG